MNMRTPSKGLLLAIGVLAAAAGANAANVTWNAATGLWSDGANWDTLQIPGLTDIAIIPSGTATIQTGDSFSVNAVTIINGILSQTGGTLNTATDGANIAYFHIGNTSGSTGTYNVSGGSTVSGGRVRVGEAGGTGIMTFLNSTYTGSNGRDTWVGDGAGSVGTLSISGTSTWGINGDAMVVGRGGGTGTLNVSDTAQVTVAGNNYYAGDGLGSTSNINVTGSGKITVTTGEMWVGQNNSHGFLNISDNGNVTISNNWFSIARQGSGSSQGTVVISGNGVLQKNGGGNFVIGDGNAGSLTIKDNATLGVNGEIWVGQAGSGNGTLNIQGGTVNVNNWVALGRDGVANVTMSGGAINKTGNGNFILNGSTTTFNQTAGTIGVNNETWLSEGGGKTGTWNMSGGTNSLGTVTNVGRGGTATFNVSGTADVTNGNVFVGGWDAGGAGGNGTLNLNGGTFRAAFIKEGQGTGVVNLNGGQVVVTATNADYFGGFENGDVVIQAGGAKINTNGNDAGITQTFGGAGALTKSGAGTLTLANAAYTGSTFVVGGVLSINSAYLADSSQVEVSSLATLNLNFIGSDTVQFFTVDGAYAQVGVWGAVGSGAQFESSRLTGTGTLNVTATAVPEPSTIGLIIGAAAFTALARRRRH
jgi:autotransporter-associated beta strand protein/T5SS/PEP-CTERM-associated repeat protein